MVQLLLKHRWELYNYKPPNSLTTDIGNPHLEKQPISVIKLMNVSNNWSEFLRLFNKKFGQQEINFPDYYPEEEFMENMLPKAKSMSFGDAMRAIGRAGKPKE